MVKCLVWFVTNHPIAILVGILFMVLIFTKPSDGGVDRQDPPGTP